MSPRLCGALLAGGQSRRMGTPKAGLLLPSGETFAEAALAALAPLCGDLVVLGHGEGAPPGLERLPDAPEAQGPLAGLLALTRSDRAERYLVVPCDMPRLSPAVLARLLEASAVGAACFDAEDQGPRPLPLLLPARAKETLELHARKGELRLTALACALEATLVPLPADEALALVNVNTPEARARLCGEAAPHDREPA